MDLNLGGFQLSGDAARDPGKRETSRPRKDLGDKANEKAQILMSRFYQMYGLRGVWEQHWEEIAEQMIPGHIHSFNALSIRTPGQKRMQYVYDSTAILAVGRWAAIMDSILTPYGKRWHTIEPEDASLLKDRDVRMWCDLATETLFHERYAYTANFQGQIQMAYKSIGAFGTGSLFIDELSRSKINPFPGLRYKNVHIGELYCAENHQGVVDCVYRYFQLTARQAVQKWPDTISEGVRLAAEKFPETMFYFIHCVCPREDHEWDPKRMDGKGMPYGSYYIDVANRAMLSEGGYRSFPMPVGRHEQFTGEVYGRGPGMDLLPAVKMLNSMAMTHIKAGHRVLDPVLLVHDDGVAQGFSLKPGALNAGAVSQDGRPLVHALPTGNLPIGDALMERQEKLINSGFSVDLFSVLTESPEMTATEVLDRIHQRGILLNPAFARQQAEFQGPMVHRELDILLSAGLLPPPPRRMIQAGGGYRVKYTAPVNREMMAEEAAALERTLQEVGQMAQALQKPEAVDTFDLDTAIPEIARIRGTPERWIASAEQVAAARQARAQAAQAAQASQAAPGAAALIKAGAVASQGASPANLPRGPKAA